MALYTPKDLSAVTKQINKRSFILTVPCALLTAVLFASFLVRLQWLTIACTLIIGVLLIAGYDLALKPLRCYRNFVDCCLNGRLRECTLPFLSISEDVNMVDGVPCRAVYLQDLDGKGRPYERLFYLDAEKTFLDAQEGDVLHITHHDLYVANVSKKC